jgi:hypothetical protein
MAFFEVPKVHTIEYIPPEGAEPIYGAPLLGHGSPDLFEGDIDTSAVFCLTFAFWFDLDQCDSSCEFKTTGRHSSACIELFERVDEGWFEHTPEERIAEFCDETQYCPELRDELVRETLALYAKFRKQYDIVTQSPIHIGDKKFRMEPVPKLGPKIQLPGNITAKWWAFGPSCYWKIHFKLIPLD